MIRLLRHNLFPNYSLIALTIIFCVSTLVYEKQMAERANTRLVEHAIIISDDLWNFNTEGAAAYLKLAAEAGHYEKLEVINHNGDIFQSITTTIPNNLEQLLIRLHLIPRVVLITPVESATNIIGWIEVIWIPQTLVVQLYVLLFLFMIWISLTLYGRVIKEKQLLEQRVVSRTNELAESNKTLQHEYRERVQAEIEREKIQRQLEQSRKMESLGLLAGGVAHDLNNVLSGIVSYPDLLLLDMPLDSPQRKNVETIRNSGLRAADIVQDLLTLARRGVVTKQLLDINELIRQYSISPEHQQLRKYHPDIKLHYDLEQSLSLLSGSPTALKKVIMNLISNGAEAQPEGGHITILTKFQQIETPIDGLQQVVPGNYILLRVEDKGEGISSEDQQRIFEPFYTRKVMGRSGTGLGLTVVWGTVEDHGGTIQVRSSPGSGTSIDIYLPVTTDADEPNVEADEQSGHFGNNQQILVVDDVDHQREIACAILKRLNYRVKAVSSGEQAIEFLKNEEVDLIVLDMILDGGMDGLDTYKQILQLHPGQKAIIASGYSESDRIEETQKLGAGNCIRKPYTLQQLGTAVWSELEKGNTQ